MLNQLGFVALTVYMKNDIAEVSRVLQLMVRQPVQIERFNAHLLPHAFTHIKGLESIDEPIMRLAIVGTVSSASELERATKALNRLVSVFKVVADQL